MTPTWGVASPVNMNRSKNALVDGHGAAEESDYGSDFDEDGLGELLGEIEARLKVQPPTVRSVKDEDTRPILAIRPVQPAWRYQSLSVPRFELISEASANAQFTVEIEHDRHFSDSFSGT